MKKIAALILAMMLVFGAVSAFAATGSPDTTAVENGGTGGNGNNTTDEEPAANPNAEEPEEETIKLEDENGKEVEAENIVSTFLADDESVSELMDSLDAEKTNGVVSDENMKKVFGEAADKLIADGYTTVNEVKNYTLYNIPEDFHGKITIPYTFQTKYPQGEKVRVAYILPNGETIIVEGEANEAGDVVVTLDESVWSKIQGLTVKMVPISKTK